MNWKVKLLIALGIWLMVSALALAWLEIALAHPGTLDAYGCHSNKALYGTTAKRECHADLLAGQVFASTTAEYKAYIEAQRKLLAAKDAEVSTLTIELTACKQVCQQPAPLVGIVASDSVSTGIGERQKPPLSITLRWNPNAEPDLAGYKSYCGTASKLYTMLKDGLITTSVTYQGLAPGTYYCAVTAKDVKGNESTFSNEIVKVLK